MKCCKDIPKRNDPTRYLVSGLLVVGGLGLLTLVGCTLPGAIYSSIKYPLGLEFINATTGDSRFIASGLLTREELMGLGADRDTCLTLQRDGGSMTARIRTIDGRVMQERSLPLLTGPNLSPGSMAIAPDLGRVAYYDFPSKSVLLYEAATGRTKALLPQAGSSGYVITYIQFMHEEELLLVLKPDDKLNRQAAEMLLFDTRTGQSISLLKTAHSPGTPELVVVSPDHRLVAITVRSSRTSSPTIRLIDLVTQQQVGVITDPNARSISDPCFSPDGRTVGWIGRAREGNTLMVSPVSNPAPRLVRRYPQATSCLNLNIVNEQTMVLTTQQKDSPTKRLVAVDLTSGDERFYAEKAFHGRILVAGEPPTILCEMGY